MLNNFNILCIFDVCQRMLSCHYKAASSSVDFRTFNDITISQFSSMDLMILVAIRAFDDDVCKSNFLTCMLCIHDWCFMVLGTYVAFRLTFALIMLVSKFLTINALFVRTNVGKYFRVTMSARDIDSF